MVWVERFGFLFLVVRMLLNYALRDEVCKCALAWTLDAHLLNILNFPFVHVLYKFCY